MLQTYLNKLTKKGGPKQYLGGCRRGEVKVNAKLTWILCSAFIVTHFKGAQARITQFYLQTPCLPLPRKRSPDGATADCGHRHLIAAHYSLIDPERIKG